MRDQPTPNGVPVTVFFESDRVGADPTTTSPNNLIRSRALRACVVDPAADNDFPKSL
jgi:hypothetical protein